MRIKHGFYISLIFVFLILFSGCKESKTAKQFLFEHSEISLQTPPSLQVYDKYSSPAWTVNFLAEKDDILLINVADKKYEVLLTNRYQQIGDTGYFVKACDCPSLFRR